MMRTKAVKCVHIVLAFFAIAAVGGAAASAKAAQTQKPSPRKYVPETDAAVSFFRTFTGSTSGHNTAQTPSNAIGGMFELRRIQSPWIGYEVAYGVSAGTQSYKPLAGNCGFLCGTTPQTWDAIAHQVSVDWVPSFKHGNIEPFGIGGVGFYIDSPNAALGNLQIVVRPMFVYGAGLDWNFLPHAGLRIQYRGNLYKAPNLDNNFNATGAYTQLGEPMVGFYFPL